MKKKFCGSGMIFFLVKVRIFLYNIVPLPSTSGVAKVSKNFHPLLQEVAAAAWVSRRNLRINICIERSQALGLIFLDKKGICLINF